MAEESITTAPAEVCMRPKVQYFYDHNDASQFTITESMLMCTWKLKQKLSRCTYPWQLHRVCFISLNCRLQRALDGDTQSHVRMTLVCQTHLSSCAPSISPGMSANVRYLGNDDAVVGVVDDVAVSDATRSSNTTVPNCG